MNVARVALGDPPYRSIGLADALVLANADVVVATTEAFDAIGELLGRSTIRSTRSSGEEPTQPLADRGLYPDERDAILVAVDEEVPSGVERVVSVDDLVLPRTGALRGWQVVVPRAAHQSGALSERLTRAGAVAIVAPVIDIVDPVDDHLAERLATLDEYGWIVFSSENAVDRTIRALAGRHALARVQIAAIGHGTARSAERQGLRVDFVPEQSTTRGFLETFPDLAPTRILFPCGDLAGNEIEVGLRGRGHEVDRVIAYRTVTVPLGPAARRRVRGSDAIFFTSPSTVDGYLASFEPSECPATIITIGPSTSARVRARSLGDLVEADEQSLDGLVRALVEHRGVSVVKIDPD